MISVVVMVELMAVHSVAHSAESLVALMDVILVVRKAASMVAHSVAHLAAYSVALMVSIAVAGWAEK